MRRSILVFLILSIINACLTYQFELLASMSDSVRVSTVEKYKLLLQPLVGKQLELKLSNSEKVKGKLEKVENDQIFLKSKGEISQIKINEIKELKYKKKGDNGIRIAKGLAWGAVLGFMAVLILASFLAPK